MNEKAIELAKLFHETYERLAPSYFYTTRKDSAVVWDKVPEQNKKLMVAVAEQVLAELEKQPECKTCRDIGYVGPYKLGYAAELCPDCNKSKKKQPEPSKFAEDFRFQLSGKQNGSILNATIGMGLEACAIIDRQAEELKEKDAEIRQLKERAANG